MTVFIAILLCFRCIQTAGEQMKKILIVNADDFGMSKGQNYGIIDSYNNGIVTSTTAMVNSPYITHAVELSNKNPGLGIGLHFVLTHGRPLSSMKSLINENGELGKWLWDYAQKDLLDTDEIMIELNEQLKRFIELFKRMPTHIDSHHFVHMLPQIYPLVESFANTKGLPIRLDRNDINKYGISVNRPHCTDYFDASFFGDDVSEELFLKALDSSEERGDNSIEIMCHPAFLDRTLLASTYSYPRVKEVEVLTSTRLKKEIEIRGYSLANYNSIR